MSRKRETEVVLDGDVKVVGDGLVQAIEGNVVFLSSWIWVFAVGDVEGIGVGAGGVSEIVWSGAVGSMGLAFGGRVEAKGVGGRRSGQWRGGGAGPVGGLSC